VRPHGEYPTASRVLHQHSVWCPPPETTRQLLCSLLLLWTESPWTTSFTIVVPRILIRQWSRISKAATIGVEWSNILVVDPGTGASFELPDHVGGVRFRFPVPLKTSRATDTELWCAYTSASGLSVGKWFHRLRRTLRMSSFTGSTPMFQRSGGQVWNSEYFRQNYLIPILKIQRLQGDPYLAPYDGVLPGSRLSDAFFLFSCLPRRGANACEAASCGLHSQGNCA
jgi:hypothetical protein